MLRRKLVAVVAFLIVMLLATAVAVVLGLQNTLSELGHSRVGAAPLAQPEVTQVVAGQAILIARFRTLVMLVAIVFLVVINASVLVLLRAAAMVLHPVERLAEAARSLGGDRIDSRLEVDRSDEFGELARAYDSMAGQLQASERAKLETMGQVARTLNHELNNALATIELQLQLLSRKTGGVAVEQYARQIREGLARMSATVESLKHVRRIVLTDYVSGLKMLDLEQSVRAEEQSVRAERGPSERQSPRPAGQSGTGAVPAGASLT